jgi:hypothetical protein
MTATLPVRTRGLDDYFMLIANSSSLPDLIDPDSVLVLVWRNGLHMNPIAGIFVPEGGDMNGALQPQSDFLGRLRSKSTATSSVLMESRQSANKTEYLLEEPLRLIARHSYKVKVNVIFKGPVSPSIVGGEDILEE